MGVVDSVSAVSSGLATTVTGFAIHPEPVLSDPALDALIKGAVSIITGILTGLLTKWLENRKLKDVNGK